MINKSVNLTVRNNEYGKDEDVIDDENIQEDF